jgi:oxygen-independent coproporphyrinogen-3 oxidase
VYVHVPFCAHACDFCAFYQEEPERALIERYLEAIAIEFSLVVPTPPCDTAFWGGGTPGVLLARDLERLGAAQITALGSPSAEWSVEMAPGSVRRDKLEVLLDLGVTRISLGVQSLSPRMLDALGRRHSVTQIMRAWEIIRSVGFGSVNLDLIFAVPGQSLDEWTADLDAAVALGPDHISTYCLTFEEDTAMFVRLSEGRVAIDAEREREFYLATWDRLEAAGYRQYEVSNFARAGHRCLHNINTWRMQAWEGFGPSAASQGNDWRGANPANLEAWATDARSGRRACDGRVPLSPGQLVEDALIFGLRMNDGVAVGEIESRFGVGALGPFREILDSFAASGLAIWRDAGSIALTREGRLVADRVGEELLGVATHPR